MRRTQRPSESKPAPVRKWLLRADREGAARLALALELLDAVVAVLARYGTILNGREIKPFPQRTHHLR